MKNIYFVIILILLLFNAFSVFSQVSSNKSVVITNFQNYKSQKDLNIQQRIATEIETKLKSSGYEVIKGSDNINDDINIAKNKGISFVVSGYYRRSERGNLNIYSQIYHPENGIIIDALNITDDFGGLEGVTLDPNEIKTTDSQVFSELGNKLSTRIRTNTKRVERRENIEESILNNSISKDINFPVTREDSTKASEEVFKLLSGSEDIITTVSKFAQKTSEAPADTAVISREQIRRSGFRNLNEALNFVPGIYTHWAGQNWSADFRGLYVNNQIERRVLYLQDGKKLNDYFHFGEFYSDVYTDMERIEKIEVIKGPGAAIYGNNSVTGVVNVITRKPTKKMKWN